MLAEDFLTLSHAKMQRAQSQDRLKAPAWQGFGKAAIFFQPRDFWDFSGLKTVQS